MDFEAGKKSKALILVRSVLYKEGGMIQKGKASFNMSMKLLFFARN